MGLDTRKIAKTNPKMTYSNEKNGLISQGNNFHNCVRRSLFQADSEPQTDFSLLSLLIFRPLSTTFSELQRIQGKQKSNATNDR